MIDTRVRIDVQTGVITYAPLSDLDVAAREQTRLKAAAKEGADDVRQAARQADIAALDKVTDVQEIAAILKRLFDAAQ